MTGRRFSSSRKSEKVSRLIELASLHPVVSIVGMEKNTGKTVVLNHLIKGLSGESDVTGITSVGLEGERYDQVYLTEKPEITLRRGNLFATSEKDFRSRRFPATVLDVREFRSPLGRTVFARARSDGKIIISGPSIVDYLSQTVRMLREFGARRVLVDSSTSRLSPGSPAVVDAIILATGAALSISPGEIVRRTIHQVKIITLPGVEKEAGDIMEGLGNGVWTVDGPEVKLLAVSSLSMESGLDLSGRTVYVNGSLTSRALGKLAAPGVRVVVRDFSRIFVDEESLRSFQRNGGSVNVLHSARLLAVTLNPVSPSGYSLRSGQLKETLERFLPVPVFNILEEEDR